MPRVEQIQVEGREIQVYLPPGYDRDQRYPVVYACPAFLHFRFGLPDWLDDQIGSGALPPCLVVGVPLEERETEGEVYRFTAESLVPAIESSFPSRAERWLLGYSSGACNAIEIGVLYGGLFSKVAAQAPGWIYWSAERNEPAFTYLEESLSLVQTGQTGPLPAFWFVWGDAAEGFEPLARAHGESMLAALRSMGAQVEQEMIEGGHGPAMMQKGWPLAFRFLHGAGKHPS